MNRKQRRELNITEKPKMLYVKAEDYREEKIALVKIIIAAMALALNSKEEFSAEKINDIIKYINFQLDCMNDSKLTGITYKNAISWCAENGININGR